MNDRDDTTKTTKDGDKNLGDTLTMLAEMLSPARQAVPSRPSAEVKQPNEAPEENTPSPSPGDAAPSPLSSAAAILPTILQAMSGTSNLIKPERLELIKALKPYMSQSGSGSIDRAIHMANLTQAAKSALDILGR